VGIRGVTDQPAKTVTWHGPIRRRLAAVAVAVAAIAPAALIAGSASAQALTRPVGQPTGSSWNGVIAATPTGSSWNSVIAATPTGSSWN
jgi:hypothetical protein